jgi:broad specificity phosphatase PhoE
MIYLTRHGQDEDNARGLLNGHHDTLLTDIGRCQARALVGKIKESRIKIGKVYSSPLKRTKETATIIAVDLELSLEIMSELIERNFGDMTGKKISDIASLCSESEVFKTANIAYFIDMPNAESFPKTLERAKIVLNKLSKETENILLVTHGDIGKMILVAFYGVSIKEALVIEFGNTEVLVLDKNRGIGDCRLISCTQLNL